jgi:hypothetical protein
MPNFIINKNAQSNGDNEVHNTTDGCSYMPDTENQIALGTHTSCHGAVAHAKSKWPDNRINGCYYCCNPCHTR